jgi:hypothetical protein
MHALIRATPAHSSMCACACLDVCVFCQGRIGHDDRDAALRTVASAVSTLLAGASFGFENPEECPRDLAVDASNPRRVQLMVRDVVRHSLARRRFRATYLCFSNAM